MKAHGLTTRMLVVCNRQKISEALTSAKSFVGHRCFQMSHHVLLQKPTSTIDSGSFRQMVIHFDVRPKWSYLNIQSKRVQSPRISHLLYFISSYISKWSFFSSAHWIYIISSYPCVGQFATGTPWTRLRLRKEWHGTTGPRPGTYRFCIPAILTSLKRLVLVIQNMSGQYIYIFLYIIYFLYTYIIIDHRQYQLRTKSQFPTNKAKAPPQKQRLAGQVIQRMSQSQKLWKEFLMRCRRRCTCTDYRGGCQNPTIAVGKKYIHLYEGNPLLNLDGMHCEPVFSQDPRTTFQSTKLRFIIPIGSMGQVYLPTWMVAFYGKCR